MRGRELNRWLEQLASLTPRQREQVKAHLQDLTGHDAMTEPLAERPPHCPGCQGSLGSQRSGLWSAAAQRLR